MWLEYREGGESQPSAASFEETARAKTIVLDVPGWAGHVAGQNVDVRLTAKDGYQAERAYAIASAPESAKVAFDGGADR